MSASSSTLGLSADGLRLEQDGAPVFLNGINLAWVSYGSDFNTSAAVGGGTYVYCNMRDALRFVRANGGNALRVWVFSDLSLGAPFDLDPARGTNRDLQKTHSRARRPDGGTEMEHDHSLISNQGLLFEAIWGLF